MSKQSKEQSQQLGQIPVDIKNTTKVVSEDGNIVFNEGFILRKVSKFVTGQTEDGVIPIPIFYDVKTGKILSETLPEPLREEYEENVTV